MKPAKNLVACISFIALALVLCTMAAPSQVNVMKINPLEEHAIRTLQTDGQSNVLRQNVFETKGMAEDLTKVSRKAIFSQECNGTTGKKLTIANEKSFSVNDRLESKRFLNARLIDTRPESRMKLLNADEQKKLIELLK